MSARAFTFNKRRNGIVTTYTDHLNFYEVVLHSTSVFKMYGDGVIELNSGGWRTNTTKTAINRAFDLLEVPARLWQKNFEWYLTYDKMTIEFTDKMTVAGSISKILKKLYILDDKW
jgi:hypothetical protein